MATKRDVSHLLKHMSTILLSSANCLVGPAGQVEEAKEEDAVGVEAEEGDGEAGKVQHQPHTHHVQDPEQIVSIYNFVYGRRGLRELENRSLSRKPRMDS